MEHQRVITVTMNPAIDRALSVRSFAVGQHARANRVGRYPAGKGINVCRVMATLGARSIATGFVGQGELHEYEDLLATAPAARITGQLLSVRGTTRENVTIMDPVMDTETHIREEGFTVHQSDVRRLHSKVGMLARDGAIVAFCGSLPPGASVGDLRSMIHLCNDQGAHVVVDTGPKVLEQLSGERIWLAKVNAAELSGFTGMPTEDVDQVRAAAWSACTAGGGACDVVIATMGAAGAVVYAQDTALHGWVGVHPGRVVNSVGSGDAMLAGLLCEHLREGQWQQCLAMGLAAATANAVSTEPGNVNLADVDEFIASCTINTIEQPTNNAGPHTGAQTKTEQGR